MADPRVEAEVAALPHAVVYATLCGDRLCGLAGADSGEDLRACHALPAREIVGLREPPDAIAYTAHRDGLEVEVVSHEIKKVCLMLLKKNGGILEQIHSPLVVRTTPAHEELKAISWKCLSAHMGHHYLSHARMLWSLHEERPRVRSLLRACRVLLTGAHLMRTGEVETGLPRLAELAGLSWLRDLAVRPDGPLAGGEHDAEHARLRAGLEEAMRRSPLPPAPPDEARDALDDLLVRVRMGEA